MYVHDVIHFLRILILFPSVFFRSLLPRTGQTHRLRQPNNKTQPTRHTQPAREKCGVGRFEQSSETRTLRLRLLLHVHCPAGGHAGVWRVGAPDPPVFQKYISTEPGRAMEGASRPGALGRRGYVLVLHGAAGRERAGGRQEAEPPQQRGAFFMQRVIGGWK